MPTRKPVVLFLCAQNSCRSQMAEGFLRQYAGDRFDVRSAGLEPAEEVHPLAVRIMEEAGVDISAQRPKCVDEFLGRLAVRYAIICCADTANRCPTIWPGVVERIVWPFEDPARFEGNAETVLSEFREVRDQIRDRIKSWLAGAE